MSEFWGGIPVSPNQPACISVSAHAISNHLRVVQRVHPMQQVPKPYVHLSVDSVDLVVFDPQGHHSADRHDRYARFTEARDAALTCVEIMLDEAEYEDEVHRSELETMQRLLEAATAFEDLAAQPG